MSHYYEPTEDQIGQRRQALDEFNRWNERALLAVWSLFGKSETYIDFGSGNGAMVELARGCAVDAIGVDLVAKPPDVVHDLRRPLDLRRTFQLSTCIEVAEHLTPAATPILCETIASHLIEDGGWLVFTAAPPGQMGEHHVNLQSSFWWRERLSSAGLSWHRDATIRLAYLWKEVTGPMHHLPANVQVFVKGTP